VQGDREPSSDISIVMTISTDDTNTGTHFGTIVSASVSKSDTSGLPPEQKRGGAFQMRAFTELRLSCLLEESAANTVCFL